MVGIKSDAKSDALFQQFADSDPLVQLLELWNRLDVAGKAALLRYAAVLRVIQLTVELNGVWQAIYRDNFSM
jgi:hypothetical protein